MEVSEISGSDNKGTIPLTQLERNQRPPFPFGLRLASPGEKGSRPGRNPLASDYRVAGSSSTGCKSSPRADPQPVSGLKI